MKIVIYLWVTATLLLLLCTLISTETIGIGGLKKNRASHKKLRSNTNDLPNNDASSQKADAEKNVPVVPGTDGNKQAELPDLPIYNQGWIKYLHYTQKDKKKAKAFYKNTAFTAQSKKGLSAEDLSATDKVK